MKKPVLALVMIVAVVMTTFAGGILTNTNQSAQFVRMLSRNASTQIDAVYFNPAGLTNMKDGLHFSYGQLGLLGTGNFIGYLSLAIIGGFLASRFGSRVVITLALVLMTMGKYVIDPSILAHLSDIVPYERRGRALALTELSWSLAFILGVLPLVKTKGAGAGAQNAIGTGVMGGMISATFLAILFVPVFFLVVRRLFPAKRTEIAPEPGAAADTAPAIASTTENA